MRERGFIVVSASLISQNANLMELAPCPSGAKLAPHFTMVLRSVAVGVIRPVLHPTLDKRNRYKILKFQSVSC